METKLTLKLDKADIESVKRYAKQHNKSLSKMAEEYFKNLAENYTHSQKHSSFVDSLTGVLSEEDLQKPAKEDERVRRILKKQMNKSAL